MKEQSVTKCGQKCTIQHKTKPDEANTADAGWLSLGAGYLDVRFLDFSLHFPVHLKQEGGGGKGESGGEGRRGSQEHRQQAAAASRQHPHPTPTSAQARAHMGGAGQ